MALPTYGSMAVDWEARVDFDRLRRSDDRRNVHVERLHVIEGFCFRRVAAAGNRFVVAFPVDAPT